MTRSIAIADTKTFNDGSTTDLFFPNVKNLKITNPTFLILNYKIMKMTIQILQSLTHEEIVKVLGRLPNFDVYKYVADVFNKIAEDENDDAIKDILNHLKYENLLYFENSDVDFSFLCNCEARRREQIAEDERQIQGAMEEEWMEFKNDKTREL
jgi:hypothetical protein